MSLYAKKLAEVEHKLTTTREMNSNLQILLDKALTSQKQSSSTTSHLVRNIQMDLSRVKKNKIKIKKKLFIFFFFPFSFFFFDFTYLFVELILYLYFSFI